MRSVLMILMLLSSAFMGCLSEENDERNINLVVEYGQANGTIVQSYVDGDLVSTSNVTIEFNFSKTLAGGDLVEYGIKLSNGTTNLSVNPKEDFLISVDFSEHGIYDIIAYAIDNHGQSSNMSIVVRIDLKMEWSEFSTYEPENMIIDPSPKNGGSHASFILIDSTVSNPELIQDIGGGREVEITWGLFDEQDDSCQYRNGRVNEGESVRWKTVHFNTFEVHELRISYDEGQDDIEVEQTVLIEYPHIESTPNSD